MFLFYDYFFFYYFVLFLFLSDDVRMYMTINECICVYVINTVYLVFSTTAEESKMSSSDISVSSFHSLDPALVPVGVFRQKKKNIPENDCFFCFVFIPFVFFSLFFFFFLATAECDFTEKEAVWTGFFVRVNLKRKRKKAILFNFLCCRKEKKSLSRCGRVEPWFFFYGEALPGLCISVGCFLFLCFISIFLNVWLM